MPWDLPLEGVEVSATHRGVISTFFQSKKWQLKWLKRFGNCKLTHAWSLEDDQSFLNVFTNRCNVGKLVLEVFDLLLPIVDQSLDTLVHLLDHGCILRFILLELCLKNKALIVDRFLGWELSYITL